MFGGVAFALYVLDMALASAQGFAQAQALLAQPLPKLILLALLAFLIFHIFAGLKHLMLDFHLGDSVAASHRGSIAVIILTIVSTAGLGVALW